MKKAPKKGKILLSRDKGDSEVYFWPGNVALQRRVFYNPVTGEEQPEWDVEAEAADYTYPLFAEVNWAVVLKEMGLMVEEDTCLEVSMKVMKIRKE